MLHERLLNRLWSRSLRNIKDRNYPAIRTALKSLVFRFLGLLCAVPTIPILWILKPIFWLKLGDLQGRLGHLSLNTEVFLRRRQLGIYPDGPFYCFLIHAKHPPANHQLLTMIKRVIPVWESRFWYSVFCGMRPILKKTPFYQDMPFNTNEYYEFNNAEPTLYFTSEEIEKGRKLLSQMNVDLDKDEFVCIFTRDDAYLKKLNPHHNWDYHNTRNSNIDGLIETAKYLIKKGFIVIRVGSIVNKPINFSHEKMIDLPYSGHQNDFMDIFLLAHCKFVVSGGSSGITDIANIFDVPKVVVSLGEFGGCPFSKNCIYTPKRYKYSNTNKYLHFEEARKMGRSLWYNLADLGLEAEENSPQEILEATQEMLARLEGSFKYSPESEKLIQAYHKLWRESGLEGSLNKTPIGITWLKQNRDLYF
jgi:putative glycosyltransferase (TIGR04372 family)